LYSCNNKKEKKDETINKDVSTKVKDKSDSLENNLLKQDTVLPTKPVVKETESHEQKNLLDIEKLVRKILTTSPRYIELTKGLQAKIEENGGLYYGVNIERSPVTDHGRQDDYYPKTYEFTLYEMYPKRQLNTSRFTFNPTSKKLFEYDQVNDVLIPIEFNKALLTQYDSLKKHITW